ncbi:MAG: hypothetical protein ACFB20_00415 [Opitutales bacterium]
MAAALPTHAYEIQLEPPDADAAFTLSHNSLELITTKYVAWGQNWAWSGATVERGRESFAIEMARLGVQGTGSVREVDADTIQYAYRLNYTKDQRDVVGGGLEFNLGLTSEGRQGHRAEPQLLDDGSGFTWEIAPERTFTARFEPAPERVYFEQGNKAKLRALFVPSTLQAGTSAQVNLTLSLPEGTRLEQSLEQRYGPADTSTWFVNALDSHQAYIDLSAMNHKHKPAGRHGFLRREGERFVFEDGTEGRFWGANIQAYSLFIDDKERIRQHAKRISALGYNLIRLHHHDSATWVRPSLIADGPTSQEINEAALDSYFYWIHCLKEEGIHLWVDLHVGRPWREGDAIPGWGDLAERVREDRGASTKGYFYYNERMTALMRQFYRKLLTRENPYTGLALKDDPAVVYMLLVNENDLTHHFGNSFLPDKDNPWHHRKFWEATTQWAEARGVDVNAIRRTWEPGPSKIYLNDRQYAWATEMVAFLRQELGVRVPLATDHMWGGTPLFALPALTSGDLIDVHSYDGGEWLNNNPRFKPSFFNFIAGSQLPDFPLTITEYNFSDGASGMDPWSVQLMVAVQGAYQGWDAPMLYGYSQDGLRGNSTSMWSSYNHPGVVGLSPACALLFRRGDIQPAQKTALLQFDEQTLFHTRSDPGSFRALRTLTEQHRVAIALPETEHLPWLEASPTDGDNVRLITDLQGDFIPEGQNFVDSDTGEIRRDWATGTLTLNTGRTQGAMGWLGGQRIQLDHLILEAETPKAAILLTSLDGRDLDEAQRILLSTAARVRKMRDGYRSEPVAARLFLQSTVSGLQLVPLQADGSQGNAVALPRSASGVYTIDVPTDRGTHWFELTR